MKEVHRTRLSPSGWAWIALLALFLSLPFGLAALAQDDPATDSDTAAADEPITPAPKVELDEPKPTPSFSERVDGVFKKAVDLMLQVLFYRVFSQQQNAVVIDHKEYYTRARDSSGDFQKLDPKGTYDAESLTPQEVEALQARGKLVLGQEASSIRKGRIQDRLVDYVTIVANDDGAKYVQSKDGDKFVYRRQLSKRGLLSDKKKDELTPANVERLAKIGYLQLDSNKVDEDGNLKPGEKNPHIIVSKTGGAPVVVLWLAFGSIFFTFYMRGFNLWGFRHALEVVRGKYDNPNEPGEVTHFQALASALSATVGLGNIAGVTIAMTLGGPGAFFWMMACGFFGMSSKFVECTLGQKYRTVKEDGTVLGGPMQYLSEGLGELGLRPLGVVLAVIFAVMCILASFGGGNMFQANQAGSAILFVMQESDRETLEQIDKDIKTAAEKRDFAQLANLQKQRTSLDEKMAQFKKTFTASFGIVLAVFVGLVIIGGIKRIGAAAEKIVPTMCGIYIVACLFVIVNNITAVPSLFASIFTEAFNAQALGGGILGVLVIGVQRAAFSNEAGVGSAAIAHSAAKTEEPIREGAVALMGPFIDTIVICSMTAMVILITGAWDNTAWVVDQGLAGAALASRAFKEELAFFPWVLAVAIVLFAYSTIISWSYYGERCWERLFGARTTIVYKCLAITCVFVGAIFNLGAVLDFSDLMILSMAFPNILGCILLAPKVKRDLADYWSRYRAGEFKTFK